MTNIEDTKNFLYKIQKKKNQNASLGTNIYDERKNVLDLKIVVCVDVSGSIDEWTCRRFFQTINSIRGLSVVKVIETDDKVLAFYDYFKTEQNTVMRLQGGGGTAFTKAFEMIKKLSPDAVIFMTDGEVSDVVRDPGIPTGWVLTHQGQNPYNFGEIILRLPPLSDS